MNLNQFSLLILLKRIFFSIFILFLIFANTQSILAGNCERELEIRVQNKGEFVYLRDIYIEKDASAVTFYGEGNTSRGKGFGIIQKYKLDKPSALLKSLQSEGTPVFNTPLLNLAIYPRSKEQSHILNSHQLRDGRVIFIGMTYKVTGVMPDSQVFISMIDSRGKPVKEFGKSGHFILPKNSTLESSTISSDEKELILVVNPQDHNKESQLVRYSLIDGSYKVVNLPERMNITKILIKPDIEDKKHIVLLGSHQVTATRYFQSKAPASVQTDLLLNKDSNLLSAYTHSISIDPYVQADEKIPLGMTLSSKPISVIELPDNKNLLLIEINKPLHDDDRKFPNYAFVVLDEKGNLDLSFGDKGRLFNWDEKIEFRRIAGPVDNNLFVLGIEKLPGEKEIERTTLWKINLKDNSRLEMDTFPCAHIPSALTIVKDNDKVSVYAATQVYPTDQQPEYRAAIILRRYDFDVHGD